MHWDEITINLWSLSDWRRKGLLEEIGRVFDEFSDFKPERVGSGEGNLKEVLSNQLYLKQVESNLHKAPHPNIALARKFPPRMALGWLDVCREGPTLDYGHSLELSYKSFWFDSDIKIKSLKDFFIDLCLVGDAYYGRCGHSTDTNPGGIVDLAYELWDVFWLNWLGKGYCDFWGTKLDHLGESEEMKNGSLLIQSALTPFMEINKTPYYQALGREVFARGRFSDVKEGEMVPPLSAHAYYSVGGDKWIRGKPN